MKVTLPRVSVKTKFCSCVSWQRAQKMTVQGLKASKGCESHGRTWASKVHGKGQSCRGFLYCRMKALLNLWRSLQFFKTWLFTASPHWGCVAKSEPHTPSSSSTTPSLQPSAVHSRKSATQIPKRTAAGILKNRSRKPLT